MEYSYQRVAKCREITIDEVMHGVEVSFASKGVDRRFPVYLEFLSEVKDKLKGCKFGIENNTVIPYVISNSTRIHVYLPNMYYTLGWFAHDDWRMDNKGDCIRGFIPKFGICSPKINNHSIGSETYRHWLRATQSIGTAVKHVRAYITPDADPEIMTLAEQYHNGIRGAHYEANAKINQKLRSVQQNVLTADSVLRELYTLRETGHSFLDAELPALIDKARVVEAETLDSKTGNRMILVREFISEGTAAYQCVTYKEVSAYSRSRSLDEGSATTYTADTLPENISDRLAILNVSEAGEFWEGVGIKLNEEVYCVCP